MNFLLNFVMTTHEQWIRSYFQLDTVRGAF